MKVCSKNFDNSQMCLEYFILVLGLQKHMGFDLDTILSNVMKISNKNTK